MENVPVYPSFSMTGENLINDPVFLKDCQDAISIICNNEIDIVTGNIYITQNDKFGKVCRLDFISKNGIDNATNRIMLWRLENGNLAQFIGFNIPAKSLESENRD